MITIGGDPQDNRILLAVSGLAPCKPRISPASSRQLVVDRHSSTASLSHALLFVQIPTLFFFLFAPSSGSRTSVSQQTHRGLESREHHPASRHISVSASRPVREAHIALVHSNGISVLFILSYSRRMEIYRVGCLSHWRYPLSRRQDREGHPDKRQQNSFKKIPF